MPMSLYLNFGYHVSDFGRSYIYQYIPKSLLRVNLTIDRKIEFEIKYHFFSLEHLMSINREGECASSTGSGYAASGGVLFVYPTTAAFLTACDKAE